MKFHVGMKYMSCHKFEKKLGNLAIYCFSQELVFANSSWLKISCELIFAKSPKIRENYFF